MTVKLIIDTDPGIDDAMAIFWSALHPDISLVALTTVFGNVDVDLAARNAAWLAHKAGLTVPVYRGADRALCGAAPHPVEHIHGPEGLGLMTGLDAYPPESQPAAEYLVEAANAAPGQLTVCPIGPLTNIAHAIALDPDFLCKLKALVVMGGSLYAGGNITRYGEANFFNDARAADVVCQARNNGNVTLVGLDVTTKVTAKAAFFEHIARGGAQQGAILREIAAYYRAFHVEAIGEDICYMHDPSAVICAVRPDLFKFERSAIKIVQEGDKNGMMLRASTESASRINIAVGVQVDETLRAFEEVFVCNETMPFQSN